MKGLGTYLLLLLCTQDVLNGYLYRDEKGDVRVLRKWNAEHNRYHYWIGFRDFHDKAHKHNSIQRKRIEELLPGYNPDHLLVLVEDLSSANDSGKLGCGSYFINSRTGILAGMGSFCKKNHVPVQNVEYRYCRVVALGPVINNIQADPSSFPSAKRLMLEHLTQEIEQTYNDLLLGSTSSEFKNMLIAKTAALQKGVEKLKNARSSTPSVADYLKNSTTAWNRLEIVKNLLTFDGILLGFKLVDATLKADQKEKIIAFAGGTHIDEAYELLQKVGGYEPLIDGKSVASADQVAQAINTGSSSLNKKPEPISLELLEHYIKN